MARAMIIREGKPLLLVTLVVAVAVQWAVGGLWPVPFLLLALFLLFLFRNPERRVPASPLAIISPTDGRVLSVDRIADPYLGRKSRRIVIRRDVLGIISTHSPTEGKLQKQWRTHRESGEKAGDKDTRYVIWLQTDEEDDVVLVQRVPDFRFARPNCYVHVGERIGQGERCGIAPFGKVVEVFVPENSRVEVEAGMHVSAGTDIIATLMRS